MAYTRDQLVKILKEDFINNPDAFGPGRRNDDCVDSMCICFALNWDWKEEVWDVHARKHGEDETYYAMNVRDHVNRIDDWLYGKEQGGYRRGDYLILDYCINY